MQQAETKTQPSDEALAARAQAGDKGAEEELLLRYRNLVRYCARKFFLVGGETEDLIQVGMIGLYQAIGAYKPKTSGGKSFKNFACLCVWRRIIDTVRQASGEKNAPLKDYVSIAEEGFLFSELDDPEEKVIINDDRRELNKMMFGMLTDVEFKVFTMYMDGASCAEICETTGKSPKSVDNAIQRSKQKLRKALKGK